MRKALFKEILVLGVIMLFVGASVVPSLSPDVLTRVVKADDGGESGSVSVVATGVELPKGLGAYQRKLARTSNGDLHCVYRRSDGSHFQIWYACSSDGGKTWTEEQITTANHNHYEPTIAVDSKDYIHVVWSWHEEPYWFGKKCTVQYRVKTDEGWQPIEDVITGYGHNPSIAVDSQDNIHLVVGGMNPGGYNTDYVKYLKRTSSGWSSPEMVSSQIWANQPAVAVDQEDNVHVVFYYAPYYEPWRGLKYCKRIAEGWQEEETIEPADEERSAPSMALDRYGNVYVVWGNWDTHCISIAKRTSDGWQIDNVWQENGYDQLYPSIAVDSNDYIHVVWQGKYPDSPDCWQIRYREYTSSWESVENLTSATVNQSHPYLIWSYYPVVNGVHTNIPKNGFAFVWNDGSTIKFYKSDDLEWELPQPLTEGLVGYWSFDEGSGSIAHDYSGNGNDGTIYGATWISNGKINGALSFDGMDDYVDFENPVLNTAPYTVCVWVKAESIVPGENYYIMANGGERGDSYGFFMKIDEFNDNQWEFGVKDSSGQGDWIDIPGSSTSWTFLCGTWDGSLDSNSVKLYINGNLVGTGSPHSYPVGSAVNLRIGAPTLDNWITEHSWYGIIDEVRIYNRVLSDAEIQELYNQGCGNQLLWQSGDIGEIRWIEVEDADGDDIDEIFVGTCTGFASNIYHGYIYIFNAVTHELEWQSDDIGCVNKVVVTDLDGDDRKEIVASVLYSRSGVIGDRYGYIYVFDGITHNQEWQSGNIGTPMDLVVDDVDGDGVKEIITGGMHYYSCTRKGHVYVFDGTDFTQKWKSEDVNSPSAIVVADVDSDGVKEIVFGNCVTDCASSSGEGGFYYPGCIYVYDGVSFTQEWQSDDIGNPRSIVVDDIDGDGVKEIVAGVSRSSEPNTQPDRGYIYVFNGQTHVQEWKSSNVNYPNVKVADIDNDGTKEIIARTLTGHAELTGIYIGHIYTFDGKTHSQEWKSNNLGVARGLKVDDIDNDATKEILTRVGNESNNIYLCIFNGVTHEVEWQSEVIGIGALTVADIDNDGWKEILAGGSTEQYHGYLYIFEVTGGGNQPPNPPILISPGTPTDTGYTVDTLTPTFQWNSIPNADYYALYISKYPYGPENLVFDSEIDYGPIYGSSFDELPGDVLIDGEKYRWNMRAHNSMGWSDFSSHLYFKVDLPPECNIILRRDGTEVEEIDVGQTFDICVTDYSDDIAEIRFLSDEEQNGIVDDPSGWTDWYNWDVSEEGWDADTKIMEWSFATGGPKEIWVEVKDITGQTSRCFAHIFANFYFIHVTDTHVKEGDTRWEKMVEKFNSFNPPPAFVILSGDLVDWGAGDSGKKNFEQFKKPLHELGDTFYIDSDHTIPIFFSPGNHDCRYRKPIIWPFSFDNYYYYTHTKENYTKDYGNVAIFSMNSGHDELPPRIGTGWPWDAPEGSGLKPEQINWLNNSLDSLDGVDNDRDDSDYYKIIFLHHPYNNSYRKYHFPWCVKDGVFWHHRGEFIKLCSDYKVNLVLFGHDHKAGKAFGGIWDRFGDGWNTGDEYPKFVITNAACEYTAYRNISVTLNGIEIGEIEQTDSTLNMETSCNVSVHIYDESGNHVGLNETGGVDLEIPGAYYSYLNYNNDTYTVASVYYGEKNYTFIIESLSNDTMNLTLEKSLKSKGRVEASYTNITLTENSIATVFVHQDSVDYTIIVDDDGDGVVDREVQPDEIICEGVPYPPEKPSGQTIGRPNTLYNYSTNTTDPENDQIYYKWDFGDNTTTEWLGPYDSGETCTISHSWVENGVYEVKVRAKDTEGHTSDWSNKLTVIIDGNPPTTIKTIGNPKYGPNDEWVTSHTEFNLTAVDDLSGVNKTYYRIWYNGAWSDWIEYTGNFTLSGECKHYLEYYSVDNAGNVEDVHNQTHYVILHLLQQ